MTKVLLIGSSFSPLLGLVAIRVAGLDPLWASALGAAAIVFGLSLPLVILARRDTEPQPFVALQVVDDSSQVPGYLLTYIFPFAFASVSSGFDVAAYLLFGLLVTVLLARTDLFLVNPLLLAFGRHVFKIETSTGRSILVVARSSPVLNASFNAHPVVGRAYLAKSEETL